MKKIILASVAMLLLSTGAMAQDEQKQQRGFSQEAFVEARTKNMVEKYGLNEKQSAELLQLNKDLFGKMAPRAPFGRGNQGARPQRDRRNHQMPDSLQRQRPQRPANGNAQPGEKRAEPAEMKAALEEYTTRLKKIMTEEQFKAYQNDQQKRHQRGPRGGFGQHRNDNNKSE